MVVISSYEIACTRYRTTLAARTLTTNGKSQFRHSLRGEQLRDPDVDSGTGGECTICVEVQDHVCVLFGVVEHVGSEEPDAADGFRQTTQKREEGWRSEEHTSELQSRGHLVCRLLLE